MEQLHDVSDILWRERRLLELLAFKLDTERLLARSGRSRWLGRAEQEVELVLGELKFVELDRAVRVHSIAKELGLDADPTLLSLAEVAPSEWQGILADHRRALLQLARDVDRSARPSRRRDRPGPPVDVVDDDRGAVAVSRAVATIVTSPRAEKDERAAEPVRTQQKARGRASGGQDAVVARIPSLVDFLR